MCFDVCIIQHKHCLCMHNLFSSQRDPVAIVTHLTLGEMVTWVNNKWKIIQVVTNKINFKSYSPL